MTRDIARNMKIISQEMPWLEVQTPPPPWKRVTIRAVGGLTEVGFGRGSDLLLIVSSRGLGVLDCLSGELVARDRSETFDHVDQHELLADGIGPLEGQKVRLSGLAGGGLAASTFDSWLMDIETYEWPEKCV